MKMREARLTGRAGIGAAPERSAGTADSPTRRGTP